MAYVYCRKCGFTQDDFWSQSYNPLKYLKEAWQKYLLTKDLQGKFTNDSNFIKENGNISNRQFLARQCERIARNIRNIAYRTEEDWKKAGCKCPRCKQIMTID